MAEIPLRVLRRPDPRQWIDEELMSLREAAALFWPDGPLRVSSLRSAHRNGQLAAAEIAGKILTTKSSIADMVRNGLRLRPAREPAVRREKPLKIAPTRNGGLRAKIEAACREGGGEPATRIGLAPRA